LISRRYSLDGKKLLLAMIICFSGLHAQENNSLYKTKIPFSRDTIYLENESLNASYFKLLDANNTAINSTLYNVDFLKGTLLLKKSSVYFRFYHGRIPEIS
jgi:hypothetical protein